MKSCAIRKRLGAVDALILDNNILRLVAVPELGGRIVSLVRLQSGYEFLLQSEHQREYQRPAYGRDFENGDVSGFDECVPTVAPCVYPQEPFLGRRLPDHGDVWCLPSTAELVGEQLRFTTSLASLPLRFVKSVQLQESTVRLEYELANRGESAVNFLWSAHPLLNVDPKAEIVLPAEVNEVEVSWSKDERLGRHGDRCLWPIATERSGRSVDLSEVLGPQTGTAEKLFTPRLAQGCCGIFLPERNESIVFRFDSDIVRYVGIWICQGGWPPTRTSKQFTVALEPCTGRPDSLEEAIQREECSIINSHATMRWRLQIEVAAGPPRLS